MFRFSERSIRRLSGVHPELILIASRALMYSSVDFGVTEGLRSPTRQAYLVARGSSKTMRSKHITGDAIDIVCYVDGEVTWELDYYREVTNAFKKAAKELGLHITCGIDWPNFVDGPHIQRGG